MNKNAKVILDKLTKFEKLAQVTAWDVAKTLIKQLRGIVYGMNWSYRKTIESNASLANERSFKSIRAGLSSTLKTIEAMNQNDDPKKLKDFINQLKNESYAILYFCSEGNAGTGFDPRTATKPDGGKSLAELTKLFNVILARLQNFAPAKTTDL